jgi:two-component system, NtrC family, nitrogen regulation response regulator GlnG
MDLMAAASSAYEASPMPSKHRAALDRTTAVGGHNLMKKARGTKSKLALTILYHPDLERVGERSFVDVAEEKPILVSRAEPFFAHPEQTTLTRPLLDEHLSRTPLRIFPIGKGGVRIETAGSKTALTVRGQTVTKQIFVSTRRGVVLELGHRVVLLLHWVNADDDLCRLNTRDITQELVGDSDELRRVVRDIHNVADLDLPVLIRGETGTGKELVARAIHRASRRKDKPFVAVNLGAIPPSLAIAALFGSEKGAFTGAVERQVGFFQQANGGTLFLDEIGEASLETQVALLRVLESGEMQTVGSSQIRKVNVRIVTATDADLEGKIAANSFRSPLLTRLAGYEIRMPPLRERRDDIGRLLVCFLREALNEIGESHRIAAPARAANPWLPSSIATRLFEYDWPGNVRQLRNIAKQIVIGNRGREEAELTPALENLLEKQTQIAAHVFDTSSTTKSRFSAKTTRPKRDSRVRHEEAAPLPTEATARRKPSEIPEAEYRDALRRSRWDLALAAECLGISRASMYQLMNRCPGVRSAKSVTKEELVKCHEELDGDLAKMAERLEVSERGLARRMRELGLTYLQ